MPYSTMFVLVLTFFRRGSKEMVDLSSSSSRSSFNSPFRKIRREKRLKLVALIVGSFDGLLMPARRVVRAPMVCLLDTGIKFEEDNWFRRRVLMVLIV